MENIMDFIRAASPWVAMGIMVIFLAVRGAAKKRKGKKQDENYGLEGMCIRMGLGTAIGASIGNNAGLGISLGMLIGLTASLCILRKPDVQDKEMNVK